MKYLYCCCLCMAVFQARGQTTEVDRHFSNLNLGRHVEILEDKSKQLTFAQVRHREFSPHTEESINYGFTNAYYWVRFRLKNRDSVPVSLLLEISNAHINRLRFYFKDPAGQWLSYLTGDHFPFRQRPVNHPYFVFPVRLNAGQSAEYYLWADKHGEQIQIPIELHSEAQFREYSNKLFVFLGGGLSITGLYVILSCLLFVFFRQRILLYYWLYVTSMWLFMMAQPGFGFQFVWPEATWWASSVRPITIMIFCFFSIFFTRQFYPDLYRIRFLDLSSKAFMVLTIIYFLVFFSQNHALHLFKNPWYNATYYEGSDLRVALQSLTLLSQLILCWTMGIGIFYYIRTRRTENLWFTIAYSMIFIGGTTNIFIFLGILPDNFLTRNATFVANPLEFIIVSFLLANRYRNVHRENNRINVELAEQRQKNAIQLLEGQMIERRRLSQELHDGISLILANIRLKLSILTQKNPSEEMIELVDKLGQVGQDVRQFSQALSPVILEKYGLTQAIEELVMSTRHSQTGIAIEYSHNLTDEDTLPVLISQTLYQITQELLNNSLRHARASHIQILLQSQKNQLVLKVSDDGQGYELTDDSGGIGLQNISARAESLNGRFTVVRQKKGMLHMVQIPV